MWKTLWGVVMVVLTLIGFLIVGQVVGWVFSMPVVVLAVLVWVLFHPDEGGFPPR